jgi:TPR repeat protein
MKSRLLLLVICLSFTRVLIAQPFDGLTTQQREWQNTARFYDDWGRDIRNRGGSAPGGAVGMPDYAAQIARSQMEWAADADERKARRLREQEQARREREQQKLTDVENARFRAQLEAARQRQYQLFRERGGHGTKETPPHFYDNAQAFQWYLKQAEAGDAYAAFYLGRASMAAGKDQEAAQWLAKSDLSYPKAAALYGSLLWRGAGVRRDIERGKQLLEKSAADDQSGYAAQVYSELLQLDANGSNDLKIAIVHLGRAAYLAEKPALIESIDMTAPWDENMPARERRRRGMRDELKELARAQPEAYIAAVEEVSRRQDGAYGVMMGVVGEMKPEEARNVYLALLKLTESRPTHWGYWGRINAIGGLERKGYPDAAAHYLLPDTFNRTANSFIPLSEQEAGTYWEKSGSTIEEWSKGADDLAPRAARALLARDMGRWPGVLPRQSPRTVLDRIRALNIQDTFAVLSGEVLDGVFTANAQWMDKEKSLQWLDQLGVLDANLKNLRELYLNAPALEANYQFTRDPVLQALSDAQNVRQEFTTAQLDAAEAERNTAARLMHSNPQAGFEGLLKALKNGDALSGWQLLLMAEGKFLNILKQRQRLIDLTDERLQRDARGNDNRAATAALALHFLHNPGAVGRQWQREWRVSRPSTQNWLQLAEQKGHPWAVFHSEAGYDAANKARDKYNPEALKIWTWLAQNYDALSKTELWQRDAQLLELFPPERHIESLQGPLRALEWARNETSLYKDTTSRLASARELLLAYEKNPEALDKEQAGALYEAASELAQSDQDAGELLPRRRVQRLEMLVQSSLLGHDLAPLTVGALLKDPGFPFAPQSDESARWLELGKARLIKVAQNGARDDAMEAAYFLATELKNGQTFARDNTQAITYFALAATLGHQRSASTLASAYRFGELGVAKDAAEQQKWENIANSIAMGQYKVPAAALVGRRKDNATL